MKIVKTLSLFFILFSAFAVLVNTASSATTIKITDADAIFEKELQSVSIPTQAGLTKVFIINADAVSTKELSSVNVPMQAVITKPFILNADAILTKDLAPLIPYIVPPVGVSTFTLSLDSGLNMISLPVKPETPFTARSFAKKLGATVVIRYDAQGDEFVPFVPEAFGGDGFAIEGGQGYIVNLLGAKEVVFTGSVWAQAPVMRPSPALANNNSTWAFVVCGAIPSLQMPDALTVSVENVRTGNSSRAIVGQLENDRYAAAFVNLSRKGVIKSGDVLDITLRDIAGRVVSGSIKYVVTPSDITAGYARVNLWIGDIIPDKTTLLQNYPNPFNPETWIPFQLAQEENVTILIYNISGQLVRTLNLGRRGAGLYLSRERAAYWDGRSEMGEQTASGVYFYTIKVGDFRATRRMVIIR